MLVRLATMKGLVDFAALDSGTSKSHRVVFVCANLLHSPGRARVSRAGPTLSESKCWRRFQNIEWPFVCLYPVWSNFAMSLSNCLVLASLVNRTCMVMSTARCCVVNYADTAAPAILAGFVLGHDFHTWYYFMLALTGSIRSYWC